jgi:uncharacterized protein
VTRRDNPRFFVRALPDGTSGQALRIDLADRIVSFKYSDEERRADKFEIMVDNNDLVFFDDPVFAKGMILEVSWGYPGNMAPTRKCVVTSIKGGRQLTVTANAMSLLLNTVVKNRLFENLTRSQVVEQIADEAGYGSDARDIEDTEVVQPSIQQGRMTDAQLVRRLADLEGFEFYVDHEGFHFHRRRMGQGPARIFKYFTDQVGEILDFSIENDITVRPRPGRVVARGRDPVQRSDINATVDDASDTDRSTTGAIREFNDPESAQSRIEGHVAAVETTTTSARDAATAQRQARGRFRRLQQTAVKMKLDIIGDPSLISKTIIEVQGMGRRLSGRYYVRKVETTIDMGGYKQTLDCISDGHGGHSTTSTRARGLDLIEPGRQSRAGTSASSALAAALRQAQADGNQEAVRLLTAAQRGVNSGDAGRRQAFEALRAVATSESSSQQLRQTAVVAGQAVNQTGTGAQSHGQPNTAPPQPGAEPSAGPSETIDPEGLQPVRVTKTTDDRNERMSFVDTRGRTRTMSGGVEGED